MRSIFQILVLQYCFCLLYSENYLHSFLALKLFLCELKIALLVEERIEYIFFFLKKERVKRGNGKKIRTSKT